MGGQKVLLFLLLHIPIHIVYQKLRYSLPGIAFFESSLLSVHSTKAPQLSTRSIREAWGTAAQEGTQAVAAPTKVESSDTPTKIDAGPPKSADIARVTSSETGMFELATSVIRLIITIGSPAVSPGTSPKLSVAKRWSLGLVCAGQYGAHILIIN